MKLIAIDGGTTHTRLYLTDGVRVFDSERKKVGAGSNRDGSLASAVREGIAALLARNALTLADIGAVTASGMIGSELGLYAMPYVPCPATLAQIARTAEEVRLPDVCEKPILFFPGVRGGDGMSLAADDVMRGEETEYFGLVRTMDVHGKAAVVLPGTHCKVIVGDENGIRGYCTTMSGELLSAIVKDTILSRSVDLSAAADEEYFLLGAELAERLGVTAALFKVRVGDKFYALTPAQKKGLLTGILRSDDVRLIERAVREDGVSTVILAGDEPMRSEPLPLLRKKALPVTVRIAPSAETVVPAAAAAIVRMRGLANE